MADDARMLYVVDNPPTHPQNPPNGPYFTDFYPQFFVVHLKTDLGHLSASPPSLSFTGHRGMGVGLGSLIGSWLIYEEYSAWYNAAGPWTMFARNIDTGKQILLDSRDREGLPSVTPVARSDGRTVVWVSYARLRGMPRAIIRSYDLRTGQRSVVAESPDSDAMGYYAPTVSGRWVVFHKGTSPGGRSRIMLADLKTHALRSITPENSANSNPSVSANIVVWKRGFRGNGSHYVIVADVRNGTRETLRVPGYVEDPHATAGRYVVFVERRSMYQNRIWLYDVFTHKMTLLFTPHSGFATGDVLGASEHIVLYDRGRECGTASNTSACREHVVVERLP